MLIMKKSKETIKITNICITLIESKNELNILILSYSSNPFKNKKVNSNEILCLILSFILIVFYYYYY